MWHLLQVTESLKFEFDRQMVAVISKHEKTMAELNQKLEDQLKQASAVLASYYPDLSEH